jgi:hypothetical protein
MFAGEHQTNRLGLDEPPGLGGSVVRFDEFLSGDLTIEGGLEFDGWDVADLVVEPARVNQST